MPGVPPARGLTAGLTPGESAHRGATSIPGDDLTAVTGYQGGDRGRRDVLIDEAHRAVEEEHVGATDVEAEDLAGAVRAPRGGRPVGAGVVADRGDRVTRAVVEAVASVDGEGTARHGAGPVGGADQPD